MLNDPAVSSEDLFREYGKDHTIEIRNELVRRYLYIADSVARRYLGRNIDYDDLYQVASLALIQSVDRFDVDKGVKFTTFAMPTVLGVVKNYFRDNVRNVRMPRRATELLRRIDKAREELYGQMMQTPTAGQIAQRLDVPLEEVLQALEAGEKLTIASLDAQVGEDGDGQLIDMIGEVDPGFNKVILRDFLSEEMGKLTDAERRIVTERYWNGRSQRDIARELGVSQMYISRIERKIIDRFRKAIV